MITKKQEAGLAYNFDQDPDLWLVLISSYIDNEGVDTNALKKGIIEESESWKVIVKQTKQRGFEGLKDMACDRQVRWRMALNKVLEDDDQIQILKIYLRSLIALKLKKVNLAFGGAVKVKINQVLSFVANDAFYYLAHWDEVRGYLKSGKTESGSLTEEMRQFYQQQLNEYAQPLFSLISILVVFKSAKTGNDIQRVQRYINDKLIKTLEVRMYSMDRNSDSYKTLVKKLKSYQGLYQAVEIRFE